MGQECVIKVSFLGGFSFQIDNQVLHQSLGRSKQVEHFLQYILANRTKRVSQERLIEVLWPDESSDNPVNALKNLVYRLRGYLKELSPHTEQKYILSSKGAYQWNPVIHCECDIERFEYCWKQASEENWSSQERIRKYLEAIEIYKGEFLPHSSNYHWVASLAIHYRNIYLDCVYNAIELMDELGELDQIINICDKVLAIHPFEERVHQILIETYIRVGDRKGALNHYEFVTSFFYQELGVKPSEKIRKLYRDIVKTIHSVEKDIVIIQDDLKETDEIEGAFLCPYEVFKNLYRVETRAAERTGQQMFIALLTVTDLRENVPYKELLINAMGVLEHEIVKNLRKGDVVSRFSATQYVIMFPTRALEDGVKVVDRIIQKFIPWAKKNGLIVHYKIQPLEAE